ncbi:MAG: protein of unknown function [Nitrospira sp.]
MTIIPALHQSTVLTGEHTKLVAALLTLAIILPFGQRVLAAPLMEFCEGRPADQQLRASQGKGSAQGPCVPLVEKKDERGKAERPDRPQSRQLKVENLEAEVASFLQRYNKFLACCKTDLNELEAVEAMGDEVNELLTLAQSGLFSEQIKVRGWTIGELIPPVAQARADLKRLHAQLDEITRTRERLANGHSDTAAKDSRKIHELEDTIHRDFQPRPAPAAPKTGTGIGASPSVGTGIGMTPKTGTDIGGGGTTGTDFGVTPKTGVDIGATGPVGFEIGTTGRAGTSVGESTLNTDQSAVGSSLRQSSVGSSLPDSTVGSTLGGSTIGSGLSDSTIGSTLGGSSVGSSLQNRGTSSH